MIFERFKNYFFKIMDITNNGNNMPRGLTVWAYILTHSSANLLALYTDSLTHTRVKGFSLVSAVWIMK